MRHCLWMALRHLSQYQLVVNQPLPTSEKNKRKRKTFFFFCIKALPVKIVHTVCIGSDLWLALAYSAMSIATKMTNQTIAVPFCWRNNIFVAILLQSFIKFLQALVQLIVKSNAPMSFPASAERFFPWANYIFTAKGRPYLTIPSICSIFFYVNVNSGLIAFGSVCQQTKF